MTETLLVGNHRDRGHLLHCPDEFFPPSGDDQIDVPIELEEGVHRRSISSLHDPHHSLGEAHGLRRSRQDSRDRCVAPDGLGAASQEDGVASLDAQACHVGGHIRPGLVDHSNNAQRDPHATHPEAIGASLQRGCLPDRIRKGRYLSQTLRHCPHALGAEPQPIQKGGRVPRPLHRGQILSVDLENLFLAIEQAFRHRMQGSILDLGRGKGHSSCRLSGLAGQRLHFFHFAPSRITRLSRCMTSSECLYPKTCSISLLLRPLIRSTSSAL